MRAVWGGPPGRKRHASPPSGNPLTLPLSFRPHPALRLRSGHPSLVREGLGERSETGGNTFMYQTFFQQLNLIIVVSLIT